MLQPEEMIMTVWRHFL